MNSHALLMRLCVGGTFLMICAALNPSAAASTWSGSLNCSWGSGSMQLQIGSGGVVTGSVTNGAIHSGRVRGNSISFQTSNFLGNTATFSGSINGRTMRGSYRQSMSSEPCNWQASQSGGEPIVAEKPKVSAEPKQAAHVDQAAKQKPKAATQAKSGSCSGISGTSGPKTQSQSCPRPSPPVQIGVVCAGGSDCLGAAGYTPAEPYNHSEAAISFQQFFGAPIKIEKGQSLWSVPGDGPTGRQLIARAWDNTEHGNTGKCALEYLTATVREFIVSIDCETERQKKRQSEFQLREEHYPYMAAEECKAPWTLMMSEGWQQRDLSYWKDNPSTPVGICLGPETDNRRDSRPVREPNWQTVEACTSGPFSATAKVAVSRRGILGCTINTDIAPVSAAR